MFENYSINIIDTLESFYINFKQEHNDKIKEIFELIDIDTVINPKVFSVSHEERKLIKEKFGTEFTTVECNDLLTDIKNYIEYQKLINENKSKQSFIEQKYNYGLTTQKENIENQGQHIMKISSRIPDKVSSKIKSKDDVECKIEGYSNKSTTSFMKAGDYRLCSVENLDLNNQESGLVQKNKLDVKLCYILFVANTCVVLENEKYNISELLENFTDIKLVENCTSTPFKEFLHKRVFNSFEECESMYNTLKSTLPKETIDTLIENQIKNYINWNYQITDNVSDRIKVLELYNLIKTEYDCIIDSRQFSKILLKLNLKKKRYQDGIYYYGLKKYDSETRLKDISGKLFNGLLQEREPLKSDEHIKLLEQMKNTRNKLKFQQKTESDK